MSTAEWLCRPFRRDGKRKGEAHGENPIIAPYPTRRGTQSVWGETRRGRRRDSTLAHIRIDATARSPPCGLTNQNAASAHAIARKCAILYTVGYREAQSRLLPRSGRKMKPRVWHSDIFNHNERARRLDAFNTRIADIIWINLCFFTF